MRTADQILKRLRALCLSLPETSEVASWGHPNFGAGKRTFATFERVNGRPSLLPAEHMSDARVVKTHQQRTFQIQRHF